MNGEKMSKVKDNTVDDEIDIMGLLQAILYRWWIVLIAAITGFAIALATTVFLITPKYSATSMIYMRGSGNTIASLADLQIGSELTNDYQIIFTSRTLLTKTIKELNLDMSYGQLKSAIHQTHVFYRLQLHVMILILHAHLLTALLLMVCRLQKRLILKSHM